MPTVFIAGSMTIKNVDQQVRERIVNVISLDYDVVVGDADGVDTSIQQLLFDYGASKATVYCTGDKPRNNVASWPTRCVTTYHAKGTRAYFTAKDVEMAKDADYGLMIWDTKSPGTLSNVIELLDRKKKSVVFVNKIKKFYKVVDVDGLESLVDLMSSDARIKADDKIGLKTRIDELRSRQRQFEILSEAPVHD